MAHERDGQERLRNRPADRVSQRGETRLVCPTALTPAIVRKVFKEEFGMQQSEILHLNLRREFFAAIATKTKRIEYRERTPYWKQGLENRDYQFIQFRNGYATLAPEMLVEFRGVKKIRQRGQPFYAISLGRILKIKRWKG